MTAVRELADRDPVRWRAATHHPFLDGVRAGTLPGAAFDRWLELHEGGARSQPLLRGTHHLEISGGRGDEVQSRDVNGFRLPASA